MPIEASDARREYRRLWAKAARARPEFIKREKEQKREANRQTYEWLAQIKLSLGCKDCGYDKDSVALDFDHVRGRKEFNVSKGVNSVSRKRLWDEVQKCDVVCANCHRIRTFQRGDHLNGH